MRKTFSCQALAIIVIALLSIVGCGVKLPPIVVIPAPMPTPDPTPAPAPKPRATLAFVVTDAAKHPIAGAVVAASTSPTAAAVTWTSNSAGYAAQEIDQDAYQVTISADGYLAHTINVTLTANTQRDILLTKVVEPPPAVVLQDLFITVIEIQAGFATPSRSIGIPNAWCTIAGERRVADGSGFLHFPVPGTVSAECGANGFTTRVDTLEPGRRAFHLFASNPPPKPVEQPPAPTGSSLAECDARNNTLQVSAGCLSAVARVSMFWSGCTAGSQHDCHYYVREVANTLAKAQNDPRWGLIRKTAGGSNVDGYGEDVVAYLPAPLALEEPTNRWRGIDIIGGAGAPGARFQAGTLQQAIVCPHPDDPDGSKRLWCNRSTDIWAPVPR